MLRKQFLKMFKEYVASVLDSKNYSSELIIHEIAPSKDEIVKNIESGACPFRFIVFYPGINWTSHWHMMRKNGIWSLHKQSHRFRDGSEYYHKWMPSKTFKKQLIKIIKGVK